MASRFVVAEVPPLTLAMLRYAIGLCCLLPFAVRALQSMARSPGLTPPAASLRTDLIAMAVLGIGQFGVLIALLNYGLQHVGAAPAALIFSLFPLLTLLLAAALGRERVTAALLAGVLLACSGVAVSLLPKLDAAHAAGGAWWGELAIGAAACVGALCSVLYRPYLQRYPTVSVSAFAMLVSVLVLAALALSEGWPSLVGGLTGASWAVVGFIGMSSGVGYFWWLYALKHESPTRVTVFLSLNPLTAALLGAWLLHEPVTPWTVAALALIAAGLWLATRPARAGPRRAADDNRRMTLPPAAPLPAEPPSRPRPESLTDLFVSFTLLALQGFGGVLAVVQRELVEKKGWMTREEFVEEWSVAQVMPGPNVINLAVVIGARYFGARGAAAAVAGLITMPLVVVLGLALVYAQFAGNPHVANALRGMGGVAAGLITATGLKLCGALSKHPLGIAVSGLLGISAFAAIAILRLPLIWVLLGLGGVSCLLTWRKLSP